MNRKKKMLTALMSLMYSVNSVSSRAENLETKPVKVMTSVDDVPNGRKVPDSHGRDPKGKQVAGPDSHVTTEETVQDTVGDSSEEDYSEEDYSEETATSDESSSDTQSIYNTLIHSPITYIGGGVVIFGILGVLYLLVKKKGSSDKNNKNSQSNEVPVTVNNLNYPSTAGLSNTTHNVLANNAKVNTNNNYVENNPTNSNSNSPNIEAKNTEAKTSEKQNVPQAPAQITDEELEELYGDNPFNAVIPILTRSSNNCTINASVYTMYQPEYLDKYKKYSKYTPEELIQKINKFISKLEQAKIRTVIDSDIMDWKELKDQNTGPSEKDCGFEFGNLQKFKASNIINLFNGFAKMELWARKRRKDDSKTMDFVTEATGKKTYNNKEEQAIMETQTFGWDPLKPIPEFVTTNTNLLRKPGRFQHAVIDSAPRKFAILELLGITTMRTDWYYVEPRCRISKVEKQYAESAIDVWTSYIIEERVKVDEELKTRLKDHIKYSIWTSEKEGRTVTHSETTVGFKGIDSFVEELQNQGLPLPVTFRIANGFKTYCIQLKYKEGENNKLRFSKYLLLDCHGQKHKLFNYLPDILKELNFIEEGKKHGNIKNDWQSERAMTLATGEGEGRQAPADVIRRYAHYYMYDPDDRWKYVREWLSRCGKES